MTDHASKGSGEGGDGAVIEAGRAIHDCDVERLDALLTAHPALLSRQGRERGGSLLEMATNASGDAFSADRERWFTRRACAELLLDRGAVVLPRVAQGLLRSRAVGLLQVFERRGLLPRTLPFRAALGDVGDVRRLAQVGTADDATLYDAFIQACRYGHADAASLLLDRLIALDPGLGRRIDDTTDRLSFVASFMAPGALDFEYARTPGVWEAFVIGQAMRLFHANDLASFGDLLAREPWLVGTDCAWLHVDLIEKAVVAQGRSAFIGALLDGGAAVLDHRSPPESEAIAYAITYAQTGLVPLLARVWPVPDDLPHAAGMGDLAHVEVWFDAAGQPALGDLARHYPSTSPHLSEHDDLHWGTPTVQHVLDVALAWSVINGHYEIAEFLLDHGANIDTDWNSHEPASILHHLVFLPDPYEPMQFLVDHGIDMTIRDYRWQSTAAGWARHGKGDGPMAQWLEAAERQRRGRR